MDTPTGESKYIQLDVSEELRHVDDIPTLEIHNLLHYFPNPLCAWMLLTLPKCSSKGELIQRSYLNQHLNEV